MSVPWKNWARSSGWLRRHEKVKTRGKAYNRPGTKPAGAGGKRRPEGRHTTDLGLSLLVQAGNEDPREGIQQTWDKACWCRQEMQAPKEGI